MRLLSQIFQPVITIPKGAKIKNTEVTCKSQKLLLECGLVRPTSSGFFTLLPLAQRAIDKLEKLINHHLNKIGAQKLSLPSLTVAKLWERTGRLKDVGQELIKVEDRHGKKYLLAPTHEEAIAELLADISPISYKQLPILLYQISNKYRDEHRPKHGLLRAREFRMLDAYAVHTNNACAISCYDLFTSAYADIFRTLQLPVRRVLAPTGDMGGSLSHEWQLPASAGEDTLAVCPSCSHTTLPQQNDRCEKCGKETERVNSIEVGHTFVLGTRYSSALGSNFTGPEGTAPLIMSCYGIGITRLLAGSIEALSTETAIRWPPGLAPYSVMVIGPKEGSKEWSLHDFDRVVEVARRLSAEGREDDLLVDDRHSWTIGKRLVMADRMGYPYIVVCGRSSGESPPRYELYRAPDPRPLLLTLPEILDLLAGREAQGMENIA